MKKSKLRQIIREELSKAIKEAKEGIEVHQGNNSELPPLEHPYLSPTLSHVMSLRSGEVEVESNDNIVTTYINQDEGYFRVILQFERQNPNLGEEIETTEIVGTSPEEIYKTTWYMYPNNPEYNNYRADITPSHHLSTNRGVSNALTQLSKSGKFDYVDPAIAWKEKKAKIGKLIPDEVVKKVVDELNSSVNFQKILKNPISNKLTIVLGRNAGRGDGPSSSTERKIWDIMKKYKINNNYFDVVGSTTSNDEVIA